MNESTPKVHGELVPLALKNAPALIEAVFPAQKISYEAQSERKAVAAQTLTSLGSYWKGRKPLILVRSIVLATLLPDTGDAESDLEIFETLMAFDDEGRARRAFSQNALKPKVIASRIDLENPWSFFHHNVKQGDSRAEEVESWTFPLDCEKANIAIRWRRDIDEEAKLLIYGKALATFAS